MKCIFLNCTFFCNKKHTTIYSNLWPRGGRKSANLSMLMSIQDFLIVDPSKSECAISPLPPHFHDPCLQQINKQVVNNRILARLPNLITQSTLEWASQQRVLVVIVVHIYVDVILSAAVATEGIKWLAVLEESRRSHLLPCTVWFRIYVLESKCHKHLRGCMIWNPAGRQKLCFIPVIYFCHADSHTKQNFNEGEEWLFLWSLHAFASSKIIDNCFW